MIPGLRGTLLSEDALEHVVPHALGGLLDEAGLAQARRRMRAWHMPLRLVLGPASGPRTLFDRLAAPLFALLGYRVLPEATASGSAAMHAVLEVRGEVAAVVLVTRWGEDAARAWRDAVRAGIGHGVRWCFCLTGPALRVVDARRTYSRQFLDMDLESAIDSARTFAVLWGLLRAGALRPEAGGLPLIERAIEISESHRAAVRSSLQVGVNDALVHLVRAFTNAAGRGHRQQQALLDEALIVIYRILFLLFAEARGLVPRWHPIYRDGYTIEALRHPVELLPRPRGLWETLQSISRLAHRGCRLGVLRVTPFNGRLFSPTESPLADSVVLDDGAVRQALLALTTRPGRAGRERIAYGELGVEQLGGVYERVLDLEATSAGDSSHAQTALRGRSPLVRTGRRKATGSFYTPRPLTEFLVRRTLAPLVHDRSSQAISALRVLDPAMGSGAFLVAACRYLANAYETAVVREQGLRADELDDRERAGFRRLIAQRCLYGVDVNPMAVQLGRLSLWLATLSAERPLTFLDHRLRAGNSLVGAALSDLTRQPRPGRTIVRDAALPLFDDIDADHALRAAIVTRNAIATEPGDTLLQVRAKEHALAQLAVGEASLARWKQACDIWCAAWFVHGARVRRQPPFSELLDSIFGRGTLPAHVTAPIIDEATAVTHAERFFHWPLEFPEVFHDPSIARGFDAVIGNPPWEMLRGDTGSAGARESAKHAMAALTRFARGSGIYALQHDGHANLYQLFLERMIALVRRGGRVGVILPSGVATDRGAALLRRALIDRTTVDTLISFENRDGLFPIHRSLKFMLISATGGGATSALPCRFGIRRAERLDELPESGSDSEAVSVSRLLLERVSGPDLAIPDVRSSRDVELLSQLAFSALPLGNHDGWNVRFGRELNATEDRRHFHAVTNGAGLPVLEGKHVTPFAVDVASTSLRISSRSAAKMLDAARTYERPRLAYRDVACATNRLTLIAAIVPAGTITTHTLFCLKTPLDDECQRYLCAMFNSFVANYLIRLRVGTHVTTAIINGLPMPRPPQTSTRFQEIAALAELLSTNPANTRAQARMQALAAHTYGINRAQFRHILDTFPLVSAGDREAAMAAFCDIVT
jgi:N-6 DNA Methylase/Eco57I restriction-modification methylase